MKTIKLVAAAVAAFNLLGTTNALAQPVNESQVLCTDNYQDIAPFLYENFGEVRQFAGLSTIFGVIEEFYANELSGTWTLVTIEPSGKACVSDMGTMFMIHRPNV